MAVSTVEVRPHSVRLTGQEAATIAPSQASNSATSLTQRYLKPQADMTSAYSLSGVLLTQGQQHATSVQIASKALQSVGRELTMVKRNLTQAMGRNVSSNTGLNESLSHSKRQIVGTLERARFDGQRVVDNELRLKLDSADVRRFSVPGLNVHRLSDKPEQVRLDFPQGGSVMMRFDGDSDSAKTIKMLDRNLIPMGMRASLAADGTVLFEAKESAFNQMQQKVMVTGQGHRFPAGQANVFGIKAEPDGIAELQFDTGSREGIKQTIVKVNQHIKQVQLSLEDAKQFNSQLNQQMHKIQRQSNVVSEQQVTQKLQQIQSLSNDFTSTFQAVNAQANVRRHTVVALLK